MLPSQRASSLASCYAAYEAGKAFDNVDSSLVPSFAAMNPLAGRGATATATATAQRWQPVPGLHHSKESLYFRAAVGRLLQRAHAEISPTDLEVRANTPEFRVEDGDWVAHKGQPTFALDTPQFLNCVARVPASLIISQHQVSHAVPPKLVSGLLRKRGEGIKAFKRRYMELDGSVLAYYRKRPEKHGIPLSREEKKAYEKGFIDLDRVSSVQPMDNKSEPFGFLLVTTARTWVLAAESETEYHRWVKALCGVVKFSAVHVIYKRQFQLREVNAQAITDVRMAVTTSDTVGEIVEHIFNCYKQALDAAPLKPYDPAEYLLKITGFRDYMIDRFRILNEYVHVRECLMTKKTIRLTVVHKSIIRETAMLNLSIRSSLQLAGDPRASRASNQVDEALEADRSASLQMTTLGDTDWEQPQPDKKTPIPSVMVQEPFAVRIHRVLNIPRTTCVLKRTSEAANITHVELDSASVLVRIALYDGGQLIENSVVDTTDVRLKAQRNDLLFVEWANPVWHKFNIDISEVTRTMRVELTVIGIKKVIGGRSNGQEEKMLVTGINAFEVDGTLTQGLLYVRMLNNLYSCVQGPVPHVALPNEPLIHVELRKFDAPVFFDWSDTDLLASSVRPHRASIVQSSRSNMLHKEGWLRKKLGLMADTTFSYFLPQLVQAIKHENHHASPLVMLLIERAIKNPNQIGFDLFWSMKVESHSEQYRERYGTILNTYLDVCSSKMRAILKLQDKLFSEGGMLERICQSVKAKKNDGAVEMKRAMQQGLEALNELLPGSFQLPLDPRIEVGKIIVNKCRVMDSAKKPLWLVFENAEEGGDPVTVMFKAGDDVRQDCLTLQLIRLMDEMWREEGLDLAMEPYKCVATSPMTGILQIVPNSVTTADVHKRGGILGSFKDPIFAEWIHANNPDAKSHKAAINLFTRSCAGYCIATYVLGIGDRHNDNIMISSAGRYFHIDFGHFLGHLKYSLGMARERSPFVFTKEMVYVMGGTQGKDFGTFLDIASIAYNVLRRHMHLLVSLLLLMVPADMPELTGRDDINYIVSTLKPEFSEEQACESLLQTVSNCLGSWSRRFDNTIHNLVH
ncbi:phosphatidylinositol 3 and 4-kinase-like protein [Phytophthora cinnamomi]|uniref:phosphatidylinositol 3 and 4-kinase-like protein n=1 Tax=Phytophthora cinnamomi TaxID=4785 RepID=UPI0035599334|nr:phosphatidylinositol 3 and 4-kinase-like protein [Phytophthora cinnamomi]